MNIRAINEAIEIAMKEDYKELQNDKSLDIYRKVLDNNEKIDDYIFQDKKHVLIKFHNVTPKDRKQVIILDDKFEERLNKAYDKCRKVNESLNSEKKTMKESHSFTQDELANNRFVKLYQKCYEYRKEHPEMEAYEIANKLCFNANEGWVNTDEIAQTWADMFVYDGAKDEDLIQKIREDIIEMIEEYLLDDEQDGDFE